MGIDHKRESLENRKQEIKRELAGMGESRHQTDNSALVDLERALMQELDHVDNQIKLLDGYINQIRHDETSTDA